MHVTERLRQSEGAPTLLLLWETWADMVRLANRVVYSNVGARQDAGQRDGNGVGLVTKIGSKWRRAAIPL